MATRREERKVVTALFADVVGSTALAERLDPEDFRELIDEALEHMIASIERYGGTVERVMGDGVLALFGAPVVHEDDPERAVLAALEIVGRIDEYAVELAQSRGIEGFCVRVGVETGLAVVGRIGRGEQAEWGTTGDSLNTAARLQAASRPRSVLVGAATQRLVEHLFEWSEPRDLELKGKAEPVRAYEARAARSGVERRPRPAPLVARLVGREAELALLEAAVADVRAGRGGVLLVFGEAGMGKSRLLAEGRALLGAAPPPGREPLWLQGRCMSYAESFPYWPFQDLLRGWLEREGAGREPRVALGERLAELLPDEASDWRPFLEPVLGLTPEPGAGDRLAALSPEALQHQTVSAVRRLLRRLAEDAPVVIAIDDLHWADASSLALAEQLLSVAEEAAVLVILAARPERDHTSWRISEVAERELPQQRREIRLEGLAGAADRRLLEELVGVGVLPPDLQQRVLERGEGNPFYIEELVRSMVDAGALVREGSGWRFVSEVPFEISDSVEKVVLARIDRLGPEPRRVLDAACVLGRHFELDVLQAVLAPSGLPAAAFGELQRLDLVNEGARRPRPEYRFKHSLIQETAYGCLLRRPRQELHRRAAEALESLPGEADERFGLLAHHWENAGELVKALEYHRHAGDAARRIYAAEEAIEHYGAALAAARRVGLAESDPVVYGLHLARGSGPWGFGAGAERDLGAALEGARLARDRESEMHALHQLSVARRLADFRQALQLLDEALEIAEELDDAASQARVLARLSIMDSNRLSFDRALDRARRSLELARRAGDDESLASAMDSVKLAALQIGDLQELDRTTAELAALHRRRGDDWLLLFALLESSFVPMAEGRFEHALERAREALIVSERIDDRLGRPLVLDAISWAHRCRGDYGQALASVREAADAAARIEMREWIAWTAATLGWTLLELRSPEAALRELEAGAAAAERVGAPNQQIRCLSLLAWATSLVGDSRRANRLAEDALRLLEQVSVPSGRAWLFGAHAYIGLARTLLALGAPERAEALVRPVLAAAEDAPWKEFVARFLLVIADCRIASGDLSGAETSLRSALETASSCEMPGPALDAHAALARLHAGLGNDRRGREHAADADALARRLAASIDDEQLAAAFLGRALSDRAAQA